ncbi:MAG: hypothetical protein D6753_13595, partial [Planctomycetota bacterium]
GEGESAQTVQSSGDLRHLAGWPSAPAGPWQGPETRGADTWWREAMAGDADSEAIVLESVTASPVHAALSALPRAVFDFERQALDDSSDDLFASAVDAVLADEMTEDDLHLL